MIIVNAGGLCCPDASSAEGYKSSDHNQETSMFSVEQPVFPAGHLPGALPPKVNQSLY